jgi:glycosyltransferase involved in cell wall biosynthesis
MRDQTIAVVSNTSWFIYNFHLALLKTLQNEGYRVVVIAPKDNYSDRFEAFGIQYIEIRMNNKGTNPVEDSRLIYDFYRLYKRIAPDVILQYTIKPNIYGSFAAGMLKIPVISSITGLGTVFLNDGISSRIAKWLYKNALRFATDVFFLNSADRALFIDSKLVEAKKASLMPGSGIDTELFMPRKKRQDDDGKFRFLLIARLIKDKGIVEYANAAKKIREKGNSQAEFLLLGAYYPGNPTAITEQEIAEWEEEGIIHYLGTNDDVPSVIADVDCVVLPSYREGISQVLLEAASMAKPIIATDVPGCREVVEDGVNGYLCKAKNVDDLAMQMEKMLLLEEEVCREMGNKGREKVIDEFDEAVVNRKYLAKIEEILGDSVIS